MHLFTIGPLPAQSPDAGAPVLTCSSGNEDFLAVNLQSGEALLLDIRRRDPLQLRSRPLKQNLFAAIGRPADQPAAVGEILLGPIYSGDRVAAVLYVEPRIGYVAYFDNFTRGGKIGEFASVLGRPFEPLANTDDNFALLMRRTGSGNTEGAYLYHATSGQALYVDGLRKLDSELEARTTSALPKLNGRVTVAEIHAGNRSSAAYLLLGSADGAAHLVQMGSTPTELSVRALDLGLGAALGDAAQAGPQRLVAVPIQGGGQVTLAVLVLDAGSGAMALIDDIVGTPRLVPLTARLDTLFEGGAGQHTLAAVPHLGLDGTTLGIWVLDSQSRRTVYISNPASPEDLRVMPVTLGQS